MFIAAAKAVAEQVTAENLALGLIYPPQSAILKSSLHVAERVAQAIFDTGLGGVERPMDMTAYIQSNVYRPEYRPLL